MKTASDKTAQRKAAADRVNPRLSMQSDSASEKLFSSGGSSGSKEAAKKEEGGEKKKGKEKDSSEKISISGFQFPTQKKGLPNDIKNGLHQLKKQTQLKAKGVPINDDPTLEKEADVMGAKALQQHS